jgi:ribosomal protein S18 acetylase RimI-like enzyme
MARARGKSTDRSAPPHQTKSKSLEEIAEKLLAPPAPIAPVPPPATKTKTKARAPKRISPRKPIVPAPAEPAPADAKTKTKTKTKTKRKPKPPPTRPPLGRVEGQLKPRDEQDEAPVHIKVRRMHRRDIKRVWDFLKRSFRDVNRETVEYQRPRSKQRFEESYDDQGIEQLLFEVDGEIVGYAECAFEVTGSDNWINPKYFESRDMSPLFVEELATSPDYQGQGVGSFMLEQLQHLARIHGCTHLVLEVAENNEDALAFYRRRAFFKLDAALFMAMKVDREPDLLPPRPLKSRQTVPPDDSGA